MNSISRIILTKTSLLLQYRYYSDCWNSWYLFNTSLCLKSLFNFNTTPSRTLKSQTNCILQAHFSLVFIHQFLRCQLKNSMAKWLVWMVPSKMLFKRFQIDFKKKRKSRFNRFPLFTRFEIKWIPTKFWTSFSVFFLLIWISCCGSKFRSLQLLLRPLNYRNWAVYLIVSKTSVLEHFWVEEREFYILLRQNRTM